MGRVVVSGGGGGGGEVVVRAKPSAVVEAEESGRVITNIPSKDIMVLSKDSSYHSKYLKGVL